jgi:hypothetical protein
VFSSTSLAEEGIECIVASSDCLVRWHLAIRLDAVLQAEKLPARIANLHTALSEVEAQNFTHDCNEV